MKQDWEGMLDREVRGLDSEFWNIYKHKVSSKAILGFTMHTSEKNVL